MQAKIFPSVARGRMIAPPSKSAAHRLLICAGFSPERSVIHGVAASQDMLATMDCLRALGAEIDYTEGVVTIHGVDPAAAPDCTLPCRECGSTMRFFVPVALLSGSKIRLTGSETLLKRPMSVYESICAEQGLSYALDSSALTVSGRLTPGRYSVAGNISSQFISGLCFALPLLRGDSEIEIIPPVESRPYIDMTLEALRAFGVRASFTSPTTISIPGGQHYAGRELAVEGDYSNAAFFEALTTLGGEVFMLGLRPDSLQGDRVYRRYFKALAAGFADINLSDCPDLGPVCMAVAAAKHGAHFRGTRRLRIKESDRCACMAEELAKFGVRCAVGEDDMTVFPSALKAPTESLSGHNDHRIVMALSVLATLTGGVIEGAQAVNKSLPDFFERLKTLGIEVETDGMDQ